MALNRKRVNARHHLYEHSHNTASSSPYDFLPIQTNPSLPDHENKYGSTDNDNDIETIIIFTWTEPQKQQFLKDNIPDRQLFQQIINSKSSNEFAEYFALQSIYKFAKISSNYSPEKRSKQQYAGTKNESLLHERRTMELLCIYLFPNIFITMNRFTTKIKNLVDAAKFVFVNCVDMGVHGLFTKSEQRLPAPVTTLMTIPAQAFNDDKMMTLIIYYFNENVKLQHDVTVHELRKFIKKIKPKPSTPSKTSTANTIQTDDDNLLDHNQLDDNLLDDNDDNLLDYNLLYDNLHYGNLLYDNLFDDNLLDDNLLDDNQLCDESINLSQPSTAHIDIPPSNELISADQHQLSTVNQLDNAERNSSNATVQQNPNNVIRLQDVVQSAEKLLKGRFDSADYEDWQWPHENEHEQQDDHNLMLIISQELYCWGKTFITLSRFNNMRHDLTSDKSKALNDELQHSAINVILLITDISILEPRQTRQHQMRFIDMQHESLSCPVLPSLALEMIAGDTMLPGYQPLHLIFATDMHSDQTVNNIAADIKQRQQNLSELQTRLQYLEHQFNLSIKVDSRTNASTKIIKVLMTKNQQLIESQQQKIAKQQSAMKAEIDQLGKQYAEIPRQIPLGPPDGCRRTLWELPQQKLANDQLLAFEATTLLERQPMSSIQEYVYCMLHWEFIQHKEVIWRRYLQQIQSNSERSSKIFLSAASYYGNLIVQTPLPATRLPSPANIINWYVTTERDRITLHAARSSIHSHSESYKLRISHLMKALPKSSQMKFEQHPYYHSRNVGKEYENDLQSMSPTEQQDNEELIQFVLDHHLFQPLQALAIES